MRGLWLFLSLLLTTPATANARSLGEVALEVFNTLTAEATVVHVQTPPKNCKLKLASAGWVKRQCEVEEAGRKKSL